VSAKDLETYGPVARGFCGNPLFLSLPTNSIKLLAARGGPGTPYIWIDPPWDLSRNGQLLATAADYPNPQDPDYKAKHDAWGHEVRPLLDGAVLEGVTGYSDGTTEFSFAGALKLSCPDLGSTEDSSWYDDWYASA